jgi:hypothetical protein
MTAFSHTRDHFLDGKDDAEWDPQKEGKFPPKSAEGFFGGALADKRLCDVFCRQVGNGTKFFGKTNPTETPEVCTCRSRTCTDLPECSVPYSNTPENILAAFEFSIAVVIFYPKK